MENLLPCPICGQRPKLNTLEPEHQNMKYFCGVHVACGDWGKNEDWALADWNRRVQDYKDASERVNTHGTPEFLERQGNLKSYAYCEDCEYITDTMTMKDLIFKVSMDGGYITSDKEGGYYSQCPKCGSENLSLGD